MRALWRDEDGAWRTTLRGRQVLADPRINKGTAFGDSERRDLGLTGLIPAAHLTLDDQVARVYPQYARYAAITRGEPALALSPRAERRCVIKLAGCLRQLYVAVWGRPGMGVADSDAASGCVARGCPA